MQFVPRWEKRKARRLDPSAVPFRDDGARRKPRRLQRRGIGILAGLVVLAAGVQLCANDQDVGTHLLAGLWHSRDKLTSGECHVTYQVTKGDIEKVGWKTMQRNYLAFDIPNARWRWDFGGAVATKYAASEGVVYTHGVGSYVVDTTVAVRDLSDPNLMPFDPRIVGLHHVSTIALRWEYESLRDAIRKLSFVSLTKADNGQYELILGEPPVVEGGDSYVKLLVYQVDSARGLPLSVETRVRVESSGETVTTDRSITTWRDMNRVWVPLTIDSMTLQDNRHGRLDFEWIRVNEPIAAARFNYHDFGLPDGTIIVDSRMGRRVVVETIGQPEPAAVVEPARRTWLRVLVGCGILGLLIAVIVIVSWRRRHSPLSHVT